MASHPLTDATAKDTAAAYQRHKSQSKAAVALGITRSTLQHRLRSPIVQRFLSEIPPEAEIRLPDFPDEDVPIEDVIGHLSKSFTKRQASHAAHTWFPVRVTNDKPIGVLWFGDPHIDDNGCNWPVLESHIEICRTVSGIYGANIGDTTNNWAGRLVRLYANQDTSVKTARRLAEWFMLSAGVKWMIWILGNHDAWGDGSEILARMGRQGTQKILCHDWEARFRLTFPNGWEPRIYAAHNFPGHSQWNPMHGPMKEGMMGQEADLYVAGDKHNWAAFSFENPGRQKHQHFLRVRGYKFLDDYARRIGKLEQQSGCGILTVFDPTDRSIIWFEDVAKGADYLTYLRGRS